MPICANPNTIHPIQNKNPQLERRRAAAASAQRAAELAEQRYAGGLIDFASLLQTQRSQITADDDVTTASAALATQHVRLYKALGGGWAPEAPDATDGEADRTAAKAAR